MMSRVIWIETIYQKKKENINKPFIQKNINKPNNYIELIKFKNSSSVGKILFFFLIIFLNLNLNLRNLV